MAAIPISIRCGLHLGHSVLNLNKRTYLCIHMVPMNLTRMYFLAVHFILWSASVSYSL